MKTVMCFGAFDLFHDGHRHFISQAQKLGDKLIVTVARDANIERIKGVVPMYDELDRVDEIKDNFPEAEVVLGDKEDFYKCLNCYKPDVIALGYDQHANEEVIKSHLPDVELIRIKSFNPDKFKSSILKKKLQNM